MASGDLVPAHEELVRALPLQFYDPKTNEISTSAFIKPDTSVSRTAVLPLVEICAIFQKEIGNPDPVTRVPQPHTHVGLILTSDVLSAAAEPEVVRYLKVIEDPIKNHPKYLDNVAHALINSYADAACQNQVNCSRGLANKIKSRVKVVPVPGGPAD